MYSGNTKRAPYYFKEKNGYKYINPNIYAIIDFAKED